MASLIKDKLKSATGHNAAEDAEAKREADKYRLQVTAGGSYDKSTHRAVAVNSDDATYFENEHLRGKVQVRIRNFQGLPSTSPSSSPYFDDPHHAKDQYSLAFSFVPKHDIPSLNAVWGNDFDHPVRDRLPPGFNTAFKIVKDFIDPGLSCDAYADEPWLYGPALSSWFAFVVGDNIGQDADFPAPREDAAMEEGGEGTGGEVRHHLGLPENNEKRRKHFLSAAHREDFTFEIGRLYQADFYNPYLDFGNFSLKLPGFSLKVIKYIDEKSHCLRYVFKDRESGEVYMNVNFELLMGKEVDEALEKEKSGKQTSQISAGAVNGVNEQSQAGALREHTSENETKVPRQHSANINGMGEVSRPGSITKDATPMNAPAESPVKADVTETTSDRIPNTTDPSDQPDAVASTPDASVQNTVPEKDEVSEISGLLQASATSDRRSDARGIL
ncbi:hypothetical protein B0A48_18190 [Cryoendolithus antarcticus]|uniref:Domain of unknown function at the cortex 1 domain-containing protein n=1 Tax=Cryoendolithus antarcticus TaxID=1507870 RepID=A0A1V8S948_9PEZI|nr:hypothetical protein B0A48_18190 [Cryoendolithus antarcticus]